MNVVVLKGNITRDPELKYTPSGAAVLNFGMAMNRRWTDQASGEARESTVFVECEAWNRTAEVINEYLGKGDPILINGELKFEQWEDKETGQNRNRLTVRVHRFEFCGQNGNGNGNNQQNAPQGSPPNNQQGNEQQAQQPPQQQRQSARQQANQAQPDEYSDIPF